MEDYCPTPISMRKDSNQEIVEVNKKNTIVVNGIEVDITFMCNLTRLGVSPFAINMTHKDSELDSILRVQKAIGKVADHEKHM